MKTEFNLPKRGLLSILCLLATISLSANAGIMNHLKKEGAHAQNGTADQTRRVSASDKVRSTKLNPKLGQTSSYEGYERLSEPFTQTDKYNYMDAFFMGLQLDEWYDFSDECINAFVFMIDDFAYFQNNKTLVPQNKDENWFHMYLNVTGLVAGPMSDILP